VAVSPSEYRVSDTYYIRARPDFALYDLISQRQYIFNFLGFSQRGTSRENGRFTEIHCGETPIYGYANASSNFYRHYLIDKNATVSVKLTPLIGNPTLVILVSNDPSYPDSQPGDYH
jgi:hypothetical protein